MQKHPDKKSSRGTGSPRAGRVIWCHSCTAFRGYGITERGARRTYKALRVKHTHSERHTRNSEETRTHQGLSGYRRCAFCAFSGRKMFC
ncbi:hypothetical protein TNCT_254131 [Trichonephila clavata]|uniref:Uncharacterized protein n=1 Tax=Trichonephila clavata TaxID=2740835 RepID=A0A8X6K7M5_TRICU|nr:hypothetical protein TNCT_254131 [Trichonephila clavata]